MLPCAVGGVVAVARDLVARASTASARPTPEI